MNIRKTICKYLSGLEDNHKSFKLLLSYLKNSGDLCLVGGAIRDISINKKPRDLDLIFLGKNLDTIVSKLQLNFEKNRFGGYKVIFSQDLVVDIWASEDNWAFKNDLLKESLHNIHKGCFFNYDSLAMSLDNDYYEDSYYQQFLEELTLDIISDDERYINQNPTPAINIVRALKIKKDYDIIFSERVKDYIYKFINTHKCNTLQILKEAEQRHYNGIKYLSEEVYKHELSQY